MTGVLRGAYVARLDLQADNLAGVAEKIRAQIAALSSLPARIDLYCCSRGRVLANGKPIKSYGQDGVRRRLAHHLLFYRFLGSHLRGLDFVYIRHQGATPSLLAALAALRRNNHGVKVLLEIPSWPYHTEARTLRERFANWVDHLCRPKLRHYVDRVVTFSRQDSILGIPTIRTDNGVDVARLQTRPTPSAPPPLRLLGLANLSFWHGYDRVIEGLAAYRTSADAMDILFDVVGTGAELPNLRRLAKDRGLEDAVVFHGPRTGAELDALVAGAHIAISSIGMHRLETETSNLKSREFCARAIPFVIGYQDPDFPPSLPFVFHVPPTDEPVDMAALVEFQHRLASGQEDSGIQMRRHAEKTLSWQSKMSPVTDYLATGSQRKTQE